MGSKMEERYFSYAYFWEKDAIPHEDSAIRSVIENREDVIKILQSFKMRLTKKIPLTQMFKRIPS
ncbi:hypothetical protein NF865_07030 [Thermococcus aggregans]|uniref:Uncharacterized protein n=1 Tax=Thermococcus aggregans TaxID=110163 RepID=A0A9E7SN92_THEAG|nr:hypothetical protein [Thermococcus aggregans]USS40089.1 hypothetical protein NF865_07030 [Thermococcus aggregans]